MIFVTLGTTKHQLIRPLKEIEKLKKDGFLRDEIIVQAGYTVYSSKYFDLHDFFEPKDMEELYKQAEFVICHGGTGSIMKGLYLNKKIIVVPRLKKFGEHVDDHQLEICNKLEENNFILVWNENDKLLELIQNIRSFSPQQYISKNHKIISYLMDYIQCN